MKLTPEQEYEKFCQRADDDYDDMNFDKMQKDKEKENDGKANSN